MLRSMRKNCAGLELACAAIIFTLAGFLFTTIEQEFSKTRKRANKSALLRVTCWSSQYYIQSVEWGARISGSRLCQPNCFILLISMWIYTTEKPHPRTRVQIQNRKTNLKRFPLLIFINISLLYWDPNEIRLNIGLLFNHVILLLGLIVLLLFIIMNIF